MGAHYHGPEVAPEEFPDQEDEAGGGEVDIIIPTTLRIVMCS